MPLKIKPPRGKTPYWRIRGTHLRVYVDRSSGTPKRAVARQIRDDLESAIERGDYPPRQEAPAPRVVDTFLSAARDYLKLGGSTRYMAEVVERLGETPIGDVNQKAIDDAAVALRPHTSNATRNREVYTPIAAVLHHHYGEQLPFRLRRPKGAKGKRRTESLTPADAFGIIIAAEGFDIEFATLLMCLLYVGARIGAGLDMQREDVRADELAAWIRHQKGQPAAEVRLRADVCDRLVTHLESHDRRRVFRFHYGGHLKYQLIRAKLTYLEIPHPVRRPVPWREPQHRLKWVTLHTFRHTWASWMRRYANATIDDLVDSNNWIDRKSAEIYVHSAAAGVWDLVDHLPGMQKTGTDPETIRGPKRQRRPSR